jgi:hypothetical protein
MPRGDRTGPVGAGPRTGRSMGYCSGYATPGFMNPGGWYGYARGMGFGRGWGRGIGFGRGQGWRRFGSYPYLPAEFYPPLPGFRNPYDPWGAAEITPEQERDFLKSEAKVLKDEIAQIEKRIKELEGEKK